METGMTVAYELIRSKRRTIAIVIDSEGKCRVRAPLQARLSVRPLQQRFRLSRPGIRVTRT